jgi:hypothetical protein
MAYLVNRVAAARIECLHSFVKFIYQTIGTSSFSLNDVKFKNNEINIHKFCSMLKISSLKIKYCPFKKNICNKSGCYLTNSDKEDSTKSKEVSNTINALHALGFVERKEHDIKLTSFGIEFAKTKYGTDKMQNIIVKAVLKYGPIVGVLKQIFDYAKNNQFDTNNINVGYPITEEIISFNDKKVKISTGSRGDSNTRTKSCILAWLTTAGFIKPNSQIGLKKYELAHKVYRNFLNQPLRNDKKYTIIELPAFLNGDPFITEKPLNYSNLTKDNSALRENNMAEIREATLELEPKINNRRLAIIYFLNKAYKQNKLLKLSFIIDFFKANHDLFVITSKSLIDTVREELKIANMAGIPFIIEELDEIYLKPMTEINLKELILDAPQAVIQVLEKQEII